MKSILFSLTKEYILQLTGVSARVPNQQLLDSRSLVTTTARIGPMCLVYYHIEMKKADQRRIPGKPTSEESDQPPDTVVLAGHTAGRRRASYYATV